MMTMFLKFLNLSIKEIQYGNGAFVNLNHWTRYISQFLITLCGKLVFLLYWWTKDVLKDPLLIKMYHAL